MRLLAGLSLFLAVALAPAALAQAPAPGELVVNEFMYDPPQTPETNYEWVEVYNRSGRTLDLNDVRFGDSGALVEITNTPTPLGPGEYAVLARSTAGFLEAFPGTPGLVIQVPGFPALNNTGDTVRLVQSATDTVIDAVVYTQAWGGRDATLERIDPDGPSERANFATSTDPSGGTPNRQNSVFAVDTDGPELVSATASADGRTVTVTVNEPLDPASVSAGAFSIPGAAVTGATYAAGGTTVVLTLAAPLPAGTSTLTASGLRDVRGNTTATSSTTVTYAPDTTPPALLGVVVVDATTLDVEFSEPLDPASVQPSDFAVSGGVGAPVAAVVDAALVRLTFATPFTDGTSYTLTVTDVADLTGNVLASASAVFFVGTAGPPAPGDVVINEIMYDPPSPQPASNEWIELYNRSDRAVDLTGLVVSDAGGASAPLAGPVVLAPGGYLVVVRSASAFQQYYPGVPFVAPSGFPSLTNTGERLAVSVGGVEIDVVSFLPSWGGTDASLERRDPRGPSNAASNWGTSTDPLRGTPGRQNSVFAPDETGPTLVSATPSPDGRTVTVTVSEPLDPASVSAGAFAVAGRTVQAAAYDADALTVTLTLDAPLAAGETAVTASGLRDLLGNTTATSSTTVTYAPDTTPPAVARAFAVDATTVRVVFTEPVTEASATDPAAYGLDGGVGAPTAVAVHATSGLGVTAVTLTLDTPLAERQVYTLTASGLADLAGNVGPASTARLFFGTADTPAPGEIAITEIMYDPATGSDGEYVELYNRTSDRIFDLSTLALDGARITSDPVALLPGEFAVVARRADVFAQTFPGVAAVELRSLSLANSGDTVTLTAGETVVDVVSYVPGWHREELQTARGVALERRDPAGPSSTASNWSSSLDPAGGTPGRANTASVADNPQTRDSGVTVTSPFAPDDGEAARITYTLRAPAGLVRVRIFDAGGRPVREVEDGRLSGTDGEVVWDGRDDAGRRLRAGIYVLLLEAVDVEGGTTEAHRAAIVLARR